MAKKTKKPANESDAGIEKNNAKTYAQRVKELGEAIISGLEAMGFTDVDLDNAGDDGKEGECNNLTAKFQGARGCCKIRASIFYVHSHYRATKTRFPEIEVASSPKVTYAPSSIGYDPNSQYPEKKITSAKPLNIKAAVERIAKTLHEDIANTNAEFNKHDKRLKALKIAHSFNESIQCDALAVDNDGNVVIRLHDTIREDGDIEALKIVAKRIVNGGLEFLFVKKSQSLQNRIDESNRLLSHYAVELGKQPS